MSGTQEPRDFLGEAASLAAAARVGSLATVHEGKPHVALVTPALDAAAAPLLLLSTLSIHTRHLAADPACSLLVAGTASDANPQTAPRLTFSGRAAVTNDPAARAAYLAHHPYAAQYVDFGDFAVWRLEFEQIFYVGGFAAARRLDPEAFRRRIIEARGLL